MTMMAQPPPQASGPVSWVDQVIDAVRVKLAPWIGQPSTIWIIRLLLLLTAVGLAVQAEGLEEPYVFAALLDWAPQMWRWAFRVGAAACAGWALDPDSRRLWAASLVVVGVSLASRAIALGMLTDGPVPIAAVGGRAVSALWWVVLAMLLGVLTGVVRPRWER